MKDTPTIDYNSFMIPDARIPPELQRAVQLTTLDKLFSSLYNWGRRRSLWWMQFGLACCAFEMICTGASRFDIDRLGMLFRASPRQADLMIVSGTVTKKMAPQVVRLYNQMPEPKYVIAMGACATSGGPFKEGYSVVSGVDKFLPVDVYIAGCPPTPQALLHGIMELHRKIDQQHISQTPWYGKNELPEYPVPILGPDILDVRRLEEITRVIQERSAESTDDSIASAADSTLRPAQRSFAGPAIVVEASAVVDEKYANLSMRFPGAITLPQREGHEGPVVAADRLTEIARYIRDDMGFNHLSSATAVDYAEDGYYEMVYHACSTSRGGRPLVFKAQTDAADPVLPSLTSTWPESRTGPSI